MRIDQEDKDKKPGPELYNSKPDGAVTESSSNREGIDRNSSCQEFWNLEQKSQRFEIRDWTLVRGDGTLYVGN